jgi:hypothetical protein
MRKKQYIKPEIELIVLDNRISLQMASDSTPPQTEPGFRSDRNKSPTSDPFASPFGDKPFN